MTEPSGAAECASPARLNGLVLLDKPVGLSSNAALQRVRRLAGRIKAGHCGSLDPLASGMLPICLGEATRLSGELLEGRKAYTLVLQLGERSATGDAEGEIIERAAVPDLPRARIEAVLRGFLGPQQQVPPMYSALKHDGQRLYRLARQGVTVQREARNICIERLQLLAAEPARLTLAVLCTKGTYVRVLGEDIARALGSCGRLAGLRRDYVEPFDREAMISLEQLERLVQLARPWPLLAPDRALAHLPGLQLNERAARALRQGRVLSAAEVLAGVRPTDAGAVCAAAARFRLYDEAGWFLGLGVSDAGGQLAVGRLFSAPVMV